MRKLDISFLADLSFSPVHEQLNNINNESTEVQTLGVICIQL